MEPTCPNGHRSALQRVEVRRLPGVLVFLGFTAFVVSLIGLSFGAVLLFGGKLLEREPVRSPAEIRADLEKVQVPAPVIALVLGERDATTGTEELQSLTPEQLEAVHKAQLSTMRSMLDPEQLRLATWTILGVSIVGAVVGWMMRSKKWVVQCAECGVAAAT